MHDFVGTLGVLLILAAYFLLQIEKTHPKKYSYQLMNGLGALLILYSLLYDFNFSAFFIETAWLLISIFGLIQIVREKRKQSV